MLSKIQWSNENKPNIGETIYVTLRNSLYEFLSNWSFVLEVKEHLINGISIAKINSLMDSAPTNIMQKDFTFDICFGDKIIGIGTIL